MFKTFIGIYLFVFLIVLAVWGTIGWIVWHFVSKFW